jgi:hypothetical protein
VEAALEGERWTSDLTHLDINVSVQGVGLWLAINQVVRDAQAEDQFRWPWSSSGEYTAKSTYVMLQHGDISQQLTTSVEMVRQLNARFLRGWLFRTDVYCRQTNTAWDPSAFLGLLCLSARRRHHRAHSGSMRLARQVWHGVFQGLRLDNATPQMDSTLETGGLD